MGWRREIISAGVVSVINCEGGFVFIRFRSDRILNSERQE